MSICSSLDCFQFTGGICSKLFLVPGTKLTPEKLAQAINFALCDEIKANANTLKNNIAIEKGLADSARVIIGCLNK